MSCDVGSLRQAQAQSPFDQAAHAAPTDILSAGLAAMFRSADTPAFGQMAGQMFEQANPNQQAGMLNTLIAAMGPAVLAGLLNKGARPAPARSAACWAHSPGAPRSR